MTACVVQGEFDVTATREPVGCTENGWAGSGVLLQDGPMAPISPTDARSRDELLRALAAGKKPRYVFFWGHRPRVPGRIDQACFSQWWPVRLRCDGHEFGSAEQYMMWRKATLFGDEGSAAAILDARSAAHAKALGRAVRGFDESVWEQERWEIVVAASVAKFSADEQLRHYLLATSGRVLVEASPQDRVWGIGLAAGDEAAELPSRWRGLNLLGFALMEARARLADG